jgi:tetratricopeptide (TPR) repeat protein
MSSPNDPLQPTPFDVAQPAPAEQVAPQETVSRGTPGWVLPALGGLLLLAALVIFWLPERVATPEPGPTAATGEQAAAPTDSPATAPPVPKKSPVAKEDVSPWSEAQLAKLRKEAQDVLQELLDIQFALEEGGVQQWAPEPFAAAGELAAAGDELYKTREYEAAKGRYQESLAAFQALQDSIPARVDEQLETARQAIEAGDVAVATTALDTTELLEPGAPGLAELRQRVQVLPELITLLEQAAEAEAAADLARAEASLKQAAALDPVHQRVAAELERVAAAHLEQRFNDAMSDGYAALDENRFDSARKSFRAAAKLQPGSDEAASALQEVDAAETAYRLSSLKRQGEKYQQGEQWQQAVETYEKARKIDASVLFASEGLKRSQPRARLDKQFRIALDEPGRLSDVAVAEATEKLLEQARRITPRGPVLDQQIRELQVLLQQANTPVTVTLRSDMETEVIVYKVARLGRFQQRELTLRPGVYTAVGSRVGYRDVRQEIVVVHNAVPSPITIACVEKI